MYYGRGYRKQGIIGWRQGRGQVYYFTFLESTITPEITHSNIDEVSAMMKNEMSDEEEIKPSNIDEDGVPIKNQETKKQVDDILARLRLRGWELELSGRPYWFSYVFVHR